MTSTQLPPISDLLIGLTTQSVKPLSDALSLLFETSTCLTEELVPQLAAQFDLTPANQHPHNYKELVDSAINVVKGWGLDKQADFVKGHPRIGEVKVQMSSMSAAEQGVSHADTTAPATDPKIIERLSFLNDVYERRYPGLVYITFVNGRSRAMIAEEMEHKLQAEGVLPGAEKENGLEGIEAVEKHGRAWNAEVERAVTDVGKIAKSRLEKVGAE